MNPRADEMQSGILLVDKPEGITSARAVDRVKRMLKAKKAGHAGTLDPFATGLLICCINQATRLARFFLSGDKTYQATLHLGVETDTGDITGQRISEKAWQTLSEKHIRAAFGRYVGEIHQTPPAFSALKHQGVPLYRWARRGEPVEKPPRKVTLYRLTVLSVDSPRVRFEVSCSAGTYIRSLGVDVGRDLGCGGHLSQLRRIQSGGFHVDEAISLNRLEDPSGVDEARKKLIPMASALKEYPEYAVGDAVAEKLRHGRPITAEDIPHGHDPVPGGDRKACIKVVDEKGKLLALLNRNGKGNFGYCGVFQ